MSRKDEEARSRQNLSLNAILQARYPNEVPEADLLAIGREAWPEFSALPDHSIINEVRRDLRARKYIREGDTWMPLKTLRLEDTKVHHPTYRNETKGKKVS